MGKIEEKKRQKREALLLSAFHLFTDKGVDDTSVAEIAQNAKMAKGTFYLYFRDKYDIRDYLVSHQANKVFEEANSRVIELMHSHHWEDFEDGVILLVDNIVDLLAERPELLKFISKNLSWGIFSGLQFSEFDNQSCMEIFDSIIAVSGKQYRNKNLMIYMIVELVNATCYNVILHQSPADLSGLKEELYPLIRKILEQFECK